MGGGGVFVVDGYGDGGPEGVGVGVSIAAVGEEVGDGCAWRQVEGGGNGAGQVAEDAEGDEGDAHQELLSSNRCRIGRFGGTFGALLSE